MLCVISPNGHGDCLFEFTTNSRNVILETYESKPSTELRIDRKADSLDISFFEDGEKTDVWPVKDIYFKDIHACMSRFPELRAYLEGL